jgi:hypothetical protein
MFVLVVPGGRRLHGADRIRGRKTIDQSGLKPGVDIAIRLGGLAGIGGMTVMRRGIELLSHEILHCDINGRVTGRFLGRRVVPWTAAKVRFRSRNFLMPCELYRRLRGWQNG